VPASALLVAGFRLDHPMAEPAMFVAWVKELTAATAGRLMYGSAGIALRLALQVYGQERVCRRRPRAAVGALRGTGW
jgi:hypothetical protein